MMAVLQVGLEVTREKQMKQTQRQEPKKLWLLCISNRCENICFKIIQRVAGGTDGM